jgi:hypothetical protein
MKQSKDSNNRVYSDLHVYISTAPHAPALTKENRA